MVGDLLYGNRTPFSMLLVVRSVWAFPTTQELLNSVVSSVRFGGRLSSWSCVYICHPSCSCRRLLRQPADWALAFALDSAGRSIAARIALLPFGCWFRVISP